MRTYDHGFSGDKKVRRKKKNNSGLEGVQRYIASLSKEQISRMISDAGKPYVPKGADVTGRAIYENELRQNGLIQPKLEISNPQDKAEQQADKVAEGVMKGDATVSQKALSEKTTSEISTKGDGDVTQTTDGFDVKLQGTKGQGQKLDTIQRKELENHTGTDLSSVNIHTNSNASEMSESINAKAFTHGQDIYFKEGQYNPSSNEGKSLLAHEVAHTVQQQGAVQRTIQRQTTKKKPKEKNAQQNTKQTVKKVKPYIIEKDVSVNVYAVVIADMEKNLDPVYSLTFPELKQDQEVNVTEAVGKDKKGTYIIVFYDDKKKAITGSEQILHPEKGKEIIVKTIGEVTRMRAKYKNYDAIKAKMDDWEIKEPGLKGKMYIEVIKSHDTIDGFAKKTVGDNETNYGNLSEKLQQINSGLDLSQVGNGLILLTKWKDPHIGTVPAKPDPKKLTEDQKALIATIYGEVSSGANAAEQREYIWYSMVLRVKSPAYAADLYDVLKSGAYQAFGADQYNNAKKQLDENKPDSNVQNVINTVLSVWNSTPPSDAGIQYSHFSSLSKDATKISDYYTGSKTNIDEIAENEAVYKFLTKKEWNKAGFTKEKAWKKRMRLNPGTIQYTMYVFN
ncbi:MAG: DUF4157 domain-containing protein [Bacteroidia bacterium]